jgi:DNA modification methylase
MSSFGKDRDGLLGLHPTVKPVAMIADAMRDCSRRRDIVLDPFIGSGTAILAAEKVGRRGYGLELDPGYVDVSIRRWQSFAGRDAILEETGETFAEVTARRSSLLDEEARS